MFKNKHWGLKKPLCLALLFSTITTSCLTNVFGNKKNDIVASAHNSFFVAITYDDTSNKIVPVVVSEDNDIKASNHRESDVGNFSEYLVNDDGKAVSNWVIPDPNASSDTDPEELFKNTVDEGDGDAGLVFTFPGLHGRGLWGGVEKIDANGLDEELAYTYTNEVIGGINKAVDFIVNASGKSKPSASEMESLYIDLANKSQNGGTSVSFGGSTFTLTRLSDSNPPAYTAKYIRNSDYIRVTAPDGSSVEVAYRMNKGYTTCQGVSEPYRKTTSKYVDDLRQWKSPDFIGWKFTVLQATYNKHVNNTTFASVSTITKPNTFMIYLTDLINSALAGLRQLLGLYEMNELMLNEGERASSYYYGIMPNSWKASANLLHVICLMISWVFLIGAIIKILISRSLSTINVTQRVSMMEGIKDLITTCFLLGFFPFVFFLLVKLNYNLVNVFAQGSSFSSTIGSTITMSTGFIASSIIAIAYFIVDVFFNIQYVLRAITVAVLYAIAPLSIVTLAFGGKVKMVFSNSMKQLIGNIYMQTFHALLVAFFTSVTSTSNITTFEMLVVFYSFIPLTNFIKQQVLGLEGGITGEAGGLLDTARGVAVGAVGGFVGGAISNRISGGDGGGGGRTSGSASGGNETIANALNRSGRQKNLGFGNGSTNETLMGGKDNYYGDNAGMVNTDKAVKLAQGGTGGFATKMAGSLAKATGGAMLGAMSAGASLGFGSVGDRRGASQMAGITGATMGFAGSSIISGVTDSAKLARAGMSSIHENDNQLIYTSRANRDGVFDDSSFNNSYEAETQRDIADAFMSRGEYADNSELRDTAVAHYKQQGIDGVGVSKDKDGNEHLAFAVNKAVMNQRRGGASYNAIGETQRFDSTRVKTQINRFNQTNELRQNQHQEKMAQLERHHQEKLKQQRELYNKDNTKAN